MKGRGSVKLTLFLALCISSIIVFLGFLDYSGKVSRVPHLIRVESPVHYLLGPSLFFYTLASVKKGFRFRVLHLLHLIPFLINFIIFSPFYFSDAGDKLAYYYDFMNHGSYIMPVYYLTKTISMWIYLISGMVVFNRYLFRDRESRLKNKYLVSWFMFFFLIQFISNSAYLLDHLTGLQSFSDPYRFAMNMTTFLVFSFALGLLFFPRIVYGNALKSGSRYSYSKLSDTDKKRIFSSWLAFIGDSNKPYINPALSLNEVARLVNTNPQRLSQVINEKTGMNFNDNINSLRIKEAKEILSGEDYRKLTIEAISRLSGFNSTSPFYSAFKKHAGLTPGQFVQMKHHSI